MMVQKNTLEIAIGEKSSENESGQAAAVIGSGSREGQEHKEPGPEQYSLDLEPNTDHVKHSSVCHRLCVIVSLMFLYWEGFECSPGWEEKKMLTLLHRVYVLAIKNTGQYTTEEKRKQM